MFRPSEEDAFDAYKRKPSAEHLSNLLSLHQGRAYNLCYQALHHREDAEDAAQDALFKIAECLPRIDTARAFRYWLYRLCLARARDLKRRSSRRRIHESKYGMSATSSGSASGEVSDEERAALFQALERIDDEHRRLVIDHYFEKSSLGQIATREGISKVAVWKKIDHARQSLKASLASLGTAALVPDPTSLLEACRPAALSINLVPGALANAAATSAVTTAIMGGTTVATKSMFLGLTTFIATLTFFAGGTAGYLVRSQNGTAPSEKTRELERRLVTTTSHLERAQAEIESLRRTPSTAPEAARTRISELETQVRDLRTAHEESLRTIQELRNQEQAKKGAPGADASQAQFPPLRRNFEVDQIADLLGLDSGRAALLQRSYEQVEGKIRQVESSLARVESKDNVLRIEVPPLGEQGRAIQEEWNRNLSSFFTQAEFEKYSKHGMGEILFPNGFGNGPKTIEFRREGDTATLREEIGTPENMRVTSSQGMSYDQVNQMLQDKYGHLIK